MLNKERNAVVQVTIVIAAWASFFLLPFEFFPYNKNHSPFQSHRFVYSFISSNVLLIIFYYLNGMVFFRIFLARKKILSYCLAVLGYLLIYLAIIYFIAINSEEVKDFLQSPYSKNPYYKFKGPYFFAAGPLLLFLLALGVSTGSKVITQWFTAEQVKEEITKQQLQTELSLLKSQVNPHFLFNTLNSIYSLSITSNTKTADAVMKLSRIMRYTLEESKNDMVSLHQEIDFINSYIELQKIRIANHTQIGFNVTGQTEPVNIAPLLFIPFIENAFKYGVSAHKPSTILVSIHATELYIQFSCVNNVIENARMNEEGTGMGIINTKRRLQLLYKEQHYLQIQSNEKEYKICLTINLKP